MAEVVPLLPPALHLLPPSLTALLTGAAFCVKYIGIYTGFLVTFLLFQVLPLLPALFLHPHPRTSGVFCPASP